MENNIVCNGRSNPVSNAALHKGNNPICIKFVETLLHLSKPHYVFGFFHLTFKGECEFTMVGVLCQCQSNEFLFHAVESLSNKIELLFHFHCFEQFQMEHHLSHNCRFFLPLFPDARTSDANNRTNIDLALIPNLNWLIHIAFARQDYKYCNEVIEYQFSESYDHEYLYYVKVREKMPVKMIGVPGDRLLATRHLLSAACIEPKYPKEKRRPNSVAGVPVHSHLHTGRIWHPYMR